MVPATTHWVFVLPLPLLHILDYWLAALAACMRGITSHLFRPFGHYCKCYYVELGNTLQLWTVERHWTVANLQIPSDCVCTLNQLCYKEKTAIWCSVSKDLQSRFYRGRGRLCLCPK